MRSLLYFFLSVLLISVTTVSCGTDAPPTGKSITQRDSLPVMVTRGVSKMISDSGVMRYKIVAEEWMVFDKTTPPRQVFPKGIVLERFDDKFTVDLYITADTAYCYNQNLWELRGRVAYRNFTEGITFNTEELFWNMSRHELSSTKYMRIKLPDRELEGNSFVSNEQLTKYSITWASGEMPMPKDEDEDKADGGKDTSVVQQPMRPPVQSRRAQSRQ